MAALLWIGTSYGQSMIEHSVEYPSRLQFGINTTHASIKIQGQPLFHGNLGGLQGSYEYRPWNHFYAGLELAWKEGKTKGHHQSRYLVYANAQERLGYTFASPEKVWLLTLFSGLGYRHLSHRLKQSEALILKFYYNELYIPVGFLSDYFFKPWLSMGLHLTWMPQVYPTVKIVPLKGTRWIIKNTLSNILIEFPLTFFLTESQHYALMFKPFYEHWQDGRSTAKMSNGVPLGLPGNTYNFWGAELNFIYSF